MSIESNKKLVFPIPFKKFDDEDSPEVFLPLSRLWTSYFKLSRKEKKIWIIIFFVAGAMLYASRTAMPGLALSAFFWGYVTTQVVGGHLADKHGGEYTISISLAGWSFLTLMTPYVIRLGPPSAALVHAVIMRIFTGCFQGFYYPSMSSLFSRRVSEFDRAFSYSFATSGSHIGTLFSGIIGSLMNDYLGWPLTFITIGILSFLHFLVYHYFVVSLRRAKLAQISSSSLTSSSSSTSLSSSRTADGQSLNWCLLFTKAPFWAIVIGNFCSGWMFFILLSWLPTYFQETFPDAKGWVYNTIPWLFCPPCQWFGGWLADHLIYKGFSTTFVRKFIQSLAFLGSALFLVLMSHFNSYYFALFCLTGAINFSCFHHSGISVNVQDIAPTYAGAVFGFQNMAGAVPGFLGVYVTGYILEVSKSWTVVFNLTSVILLVGWFVFIMFGTGKKVI